MGLKSYFYKVSFVKTFPNSSIKLHLFYRQTTALRIVKKVAVDFSFHQKFAYNSIDGNDLNITCTDLGIENSCSTVTALVRTR